MYYTLVLMTEVIIVHTNLLTLIENHIKFQAGGHASPYGFAADANTVVDNVESNFSCSGLEYGYYADQAHNCKVFHICMPITTPRGRVKDTLQFRLESRKHCIICNFKMTLK